MTQQGIEVFLAVAKLGNVSAAAQALYITQPAVSRHLRSLEEDLDCTLFVRGRGKRQVELTPQGRDFVPVAEKWRMLWQEAREATGPSRTRALRVASVGSLSTYLLPPVFRDFLAPGRALTFHNYHSREAYDYIAQGLVDIALISDHMYHPQVETVPAFRSPMVLVTGPGLDWPETVHPSQLDPSKELRLPWNPEYDLWHSFWFSSAAVPRAVLDQMSLAIVVKSFRKIDVLSLGFPLLVLSLMGQPVSGFAEILYGLDFIPHIPHFLVIEILLSGQFRGFSPPRFGRDLLAGCFQPFEKISSSNKGG